MLAEIAQAFGLKIHHLSKSEMEDIGLIQAMKKGRTGK